MVQYWFFLHVKRGKSDRVCYTKVYQFFAANKMEKGIFFLINYINYIVKLIS